MSTVTYSAEDDKLRLYVGRVPRDEYERLRAAGFVSTPKQDCDFVATWTPAREDLAAEYLEDDEDIGDEDYSPLERSADRAERFSGYRDKRADEAGSSADRFDSGPSAFGHQSRVRAERQATRHDRHRTRAVSQWSKAEYWQQRTAGVISNALYRSSAHVRRGRILVLEAEQRKHIKETAEAVAYWNLWHKVEKLDGFDTMPVFVDGQLDLNQCSKAFRAVYALDSSRFGCSEYVHPRSGKSASLWHHLTNEADLITAREAVAMVLDKWVSPLEETGWRQRWTRHYELRLTYERAMLEAEGGTAAAVEMEPGGWIGRHQIHKVNKSPATGRVVSVGVMGPHPWRTNTDGSPVIGIQTINIERLGESAYRAPTDEERAQFATATKARKAKEKAEKPATIPLINPTVADAERLQAHWNARAAERHAIAKKEGRLYGTFEPATVRTMTQAEYAAKSKGDYGLCETCIVQTHGFEAGRKNDSAPLFKVRKRFCGGSSTLTPYSVVVLTDKPQKPLPQWGEVQAAHPVEETVSV